MTHASPLVGTETVGARLGCLPLAVVVWLVKPPLDLYSRFGHSFLERVQFCPNRVHVYTTVKGLPGLLCKQAWLSGKPKQDARTAQRFEQRVREYAPVAIRRGPGDAGGCLASDWYSDARLVTLAVNPGDDEPRLRQSMSTKRGNDGGTGRDNYSVHTRTRLLEEISISEWEQLRAGDVSVGELVEKHIGDPDSQSDLSSGWSG